jgi:hypothetical protein
MIHHNQRIQQKNELKERHPLFYQALIEEKKQFGYSYGKIHIMYENYYVRTDYGASYFCPKSIITIDVLNGVMHFTPISVNSIYNMNYFSHASNSGSLCIGMKFETPIKQALNEISDEYNSVSDGEEPELDVDDYIYFLKLLDQYVTYESIEGVPYSVFRHNIKNVAPSNYKFLIPKDYIPNEDNQDSDINPYDYIYEIAIDSSSRHNSMNYEGELVGISKRNNSLILNCGYLIVLSNIEKSFLLEKGYIDCVSGYPYKMNNIHRSYYYGFYIGDKRIEDIIEEVKPVNRKVRLTIDCFRSENNQFENALQRRVNNITNEKEARNRAKTRTIER